MALGNPDFDVYRLPGEYQDLRQAWASARLASDEFGAPSLIDVEFTSAALSAGYVPRWRWDAASTGKAEVRSLTSRAGTRTSRLQIEVLS